MILAYIWKYTVPVLNFCLTGLSVATPRSTLCGFFPFSGLNHSRTSPDHQISISRHNSPVMFCFEYLGIDLTNRSQYLFIYIPPCPFHLAFLLTILVQGPSLNISLLSKHGMFEVPSLCGYSWLHWQLCVLGILDNNKLLSC